MKRFVLSLLALGSLPVGAAEADRGAVALGSRLEMFVDDCLLDPTRTEGNISLQLQTPVRREIVLVTDKPWEGPDSAYFSVFQDGPLVRLYYRGVVPGGDASAGQVTCYAQSTNGIDFERPVLGLIEFQGSKQNNIIYQGVEAHNFAPFLDTNPATPAQQRYKALGGVLSKLYAFGSADAIHWHKLQPDPVMTKGAFDSLNTAFWDERTQCYRCFSRYSDEGVRAIQSCTSTDFIHWTDPLPNRYSKNAPKEHFYTNGTRPCPGAPHLYLSFPKRFVPERKKFADYKEMGVSDAMFMSSRDGVNWDRTFLQAWVRPGPDNRNWTQRSNMPASGIVQVDPGEFSMYISEHYEWPDNRLRRITVRRHGFGSLHAGATGGEVTTRPVTFTGKNLLLNYATSAAGALQVEVQDEHGQPLAGHARTDMAPLFGDELDAIATWKSGADLSMFVGKRVRFRFVLKDADLFALRTGTP